MRTTEVIDLFLQKEKFLLLIHHSPDGDAIASSLALGMALRYIGKQVDIVCADPIPQAFQFLPTVNKVKHDFLSGDYEVIVTLDCGDSRRTGFSERIKELVRKNNKLLVNIDHHPKNDLHSLATHNVIDYTAPSTTYIVYKIIQSLDVPIDHKIATCLLAGLYTDTGGFKHPNTTSETLQFASALLSAGARLKDITAHISQLTSVAKLKLWGVALSRIRQHPQLGIVATYITLADILQTGASEEDIAGIATLLSTIPAELAVIAVEMPSGEVQVRMRTKSRTVNLTRLTNYLGGGGQKKAAGFSFKGTLAQFLQ